jgi:hypothetical protein
MIRTEAADMEPAKRWDTISPCGAYRYELGIPVADTGGCALFLLHNPSKATKEQDDPTSTRVQGFGRALAMREVVIANPMAYRATDKRELLLGRADPCGPDNMDVVRALVQKADIVIVGWGKVHSRLQHHVSRMLRTVLVCVDMHCFRTNKDGSPAHPLYLPANLKPKRWDS